MCQIDQLVNQAKSCFQARDYEACMGIINEALLQDPGNAEAAWLMKEAQRQWEDQRSLEEFEIYIENVKKEAKDLFDQEQYETCMGMFRFLLELEPENHTLLDYLKLSQQMFLETIGPKDSLSGMDGTLSDEIRKDSTVARVSEVPPLPELTSTPRLNPAEADLAASVGEIERIQSSVSACSGPQTKTSAGKNRIESDSATTRPAPRRAFLWAAGVIVLVAALLVGGLVLYPLRFSTSLEIQSNPGAAKVFLDGQSQGQTPVQLDKIQAGSHLLRIEKEGYLPYSRTLQLRSAQMALVVVQLERPAAEPEPPAAVSVTSPPPEPEPVEGPVIPEPEETPTTVVETQPQIAYSVIHHHLLGSCTGRLKISGDNISFRPSGTTKDGFSRKVSQIDRVELDDLLTIRFNDKNYRFEALARSREEGLPKLTTLYGHIKRQIGDSSGQ